MRGARIGGKFITGRLVATLKLRLVVKQVRLHVIPKPENRLVN